MIAIGFELKGCWLSVISPAATERGYLLIMCFVSIARRDSAKKEQPRVAIAPLQGHLEALRVDGRSSGPQPAKDLAIPYGVKGT